MGANGGWPLFLIHLGIFVLAGISIVRYLNRERRYEWGYAAIVGAWVAYVAQAFISINQIGLAVWGWILSGLLIGIEFNSRNKEIKHQGSKNDIKASMGRKVKRSTKLNTAEIVAPSIGVIIGLALLVPYFSADANFRSAVNSRNINKVINATHKYPRDEARSLQTAQLFINSRMNDQAIITLHEIVKENPRNYNAWGLLSQIEKPGTQASAKALEMIKIQNPQQLIK
jgi:hypothetical protein